MADVPLPFPRRGLDDNRAFSDQTAETTPDALNVRGVDPATGRTRGAQRAGLSRFIPTALSGPVEFAGSVTFDNRSVVYSELPGPLDALDPEDETVSEEWSVKGEAKKAAKNCATDPNGNVYFVTGATIEKRNAQGLLLWSYQVPVDDSGFSLGPLVIGDDYRIYTAVDSGDKGADGAGVYCIIQIQKPDSFDTEPSLAWEFTTDTWVRELALFAGTLKVLEQSDKEYRSYVTTLSAINTNSAFQVGRYEVPYPSPCMAVRPDGGTVTGHPYFEKRNTNPQHPGTWLEQESWSLELLDDYENRVWSWYRAEDLVGTFGEGDQVEVWPDRTGKGRDLAVGVTHDGPNGVSVDAPTLSTKRAFASPSVFFDGTQGLFSAAGGGTDAQRDACMSAVPNHGDGAYAIFIVCRPLGQDNVEENDAAGNPIEARRWLYQQKHHTKWTGAAGGSFDVNNIYCLNSGIILNSKSPTSASNDDYCFGKDNGKGDNSQAGLHAPGTARAYTSATGERSTFGYWPEHEGAGTIGACWTKEGTWDEGNVDEIGEGFVVFSQIHCGGLDECYEIQGRIIPGGEAMFYVGENDYWFDYAPSGVSYDIYRNGVLEISGANLQKNGAQRGDGKLLATFGGTGSSSSLDIETLHVVPDRNHMTRSTFRINGKTIDRWEALPMAYTGLDSTSSPLTSADYAVNKKIPANTTAIGIPENINGKSIKGFFGEIAEIVVIGRRETNFDAESLGGTLHHVYPTVLTHPTHAANQTPATPSVSDGLTGVYPADNFDSTEIERIEGWLAHRYGISQQLTQDAGVEHPHLPVDSVQTFDLPLAESVLIDGDLAQQRRPTRKRSTAALLTKHDADGRMDWCLVSENANTSTNNGDIVYEDINGRTTPFVGSPELYVTDARPTDGVANGDGDRVYFAGAGATADAEEFALGYVEDGNFQKDYAGEWRIQSKGWWACLPAEDPADELRAGFQAGQTIRLKTDNYNNLYVPFAPGTTYLSSAAPDAYRAYTPEGELMYRMTTLQNGSTTYQNAYAVAFPPTDPDYLTT